MNGEGSDSAACSVASDVPQRADTRPVAGGSFYLFCKRCFDVVLSLVGLVIAAPVMAAVAIWVRLDSAGPIVYCQTRRGLGGREFEVLKFRTMRADAEEASGPVWAAVDDVRVTRAGRVLRKVYLDELPQLWNILRGDMSFVGPRPERPHFYPILEKRIPGFSRRCEVRPGLTGLAQVRQYHYASLRATRRKYQYDMFYVRRRSFSMDLYLIKETFALVLREVRGLLK